MVNSQKKKFKNKEMLANFIYFTVFIILAFVLSIAVKAITRGVEAKQVIKDEKNLELNKEKEETNTEVLVKKPFGEIKASPVGGFAPLHVSFTSSANTKNVYWDFNDGTTSEEVNPVHVFYEIGVYEVALTVTNRKGETFITTTEIEVKEGATLTLPNVFTPNNDRVNDYFVVKGSKIKEFNIKILTRSGKVIFESNDINQSWDGKDLSGNDMVTGNYVVIVIAKGNDGKQFEEKKIVNLIR